MGYRPEHGRPETPQGLQGRLMRVRVSISRKEGLSDPEGVETARALADLGYDNVTAVRFGRIIEVELDTNNAAAAAAEVTEMCRRLLANG